MSTPSWTLDVFVNLSSALTGVSTEQLKPAIDPIGIAKQYFETLNSNIDRAELDRLGVTFQATSDPNKAAEVILQDPAMGGVARSIMKLWLLGSWYNPKQPTNAVNVVSSQAYKESLVWKIMQSHPMGYSMFPFGYWAKNPPPLEQFIQPASTASKP